MKRWYPWSVARFENRREWEERSPSGENNHAKHSTGGELIDVFVRERLAPAASSSGSHPQFGRFFLGPVATA
jgi:hypothetical protein